MPTYSCQFVPRCFGHRRKLTPPCQCFGRALCPSIVVPVISVCDPDSRKGEVLRLLPRMKWRCGHAMAWDETLFVGGQSKRAKALPGSIGYFDCLYYLDPKALPPVFTRNTRTTFIHLRFRKVSHAHLGRREPAEKETLCWSQPPPKEESHPDRSGMQHRSTAIANLPPRGLPRDDRSPLFLGQRLAISPAANHPIMKQQFNSCCETFRQRSV